MRVVLNVLAKPSRRKVFLTIVVLSVCAGGVVCLQTQSVVDSLLFFALQSVLLAWWVGTRAGISCRPLCVLLENSGGGNQVTTLLVMLWDAQRYGLLFMVSIGACSIQASQTPAHGGSSHTSACSCWLVSHTHTQCIRITLALLCTTLTQYSFKLQAL